MPRFLSASPDSNLLALPWDKPLDQWSADYLVALPRGISRHVVRFVSVGDQVYAAKELVESAARHEYLMLNRLQKLNAPAVEPVAVVTDRLSAAGKPLNSVLLTRHLRFSLPYRSLFAQNIRPDTITRLIDALVVLVARLHLVGFMWGDISLSNVLFRRDAEQFAAYLVDAETAEIHTQLTDGQRSHDLETAKTNWFGELCDLQYGGMLSADIEPAELVETIAEHYQKLWAELTGVEEFSGSELYRIEGRLRRLNALGFDVAELAIETSNDSDRISIYPKVVEAGHHSRRLMRLTGMDVDEHQAQRLLNDLDTFKLQTGQQNVDEAIVAHQWLSQHFERVIQAVPNNLRGKRAPAQIFHEVLDYRWFESERRNREVPLPEAAAGYVNDVLWQLPDEDLNSDSLILEFSDPDQELNP